MKTALTKGFLMIRALLLILLVVCVQGCTTSEHLLGKEYYTKVNIWYTNPKLIKSTNYHMGSMIPIGTKVSIETLTRSKIVFRGSDNLAYELLLIKKHSTISIEELFNRYFSTIDPMIEGGLLDSFTSEERDNVSKGNIVVQMSKEAVLASYGYPPSHVTKDLKQNYWRYWVVGRQEVWVNFHKNRVQSIEKVTVSGPPPGRKQITKVSCLSE